MATKYDVLISLIEADQQLLRTQGLSLESNDYEVVKSIVQIIAETHGGEEELAQEIYDLIAAAYATHKAIQES